MKFIAIKKNYPNVTLGNEEAILNLDTGNYIFINEVGTCIWSMIKEKKLITQNEIVDRLSNEYDVTRETCEKEVMDFINMNVELGILMIKDNESDV